MKRLRTIIVDDESLACEELRTLLLDFAFIEVCGAACNAGQAIRMVKEHDPELIFLDIQMPGRDGFEFLEALPPPHPTVIFTTAHDEFAIRAFEFNALDYLLKPVNPKRLGAALDKVRARADEAHLGRNPADSVQAAADLLSEDEHVFVREGDRCWFVPVRSISLLEAEGNHTRIHFNGEKPLLYRTILSMEERLPSKLFLRANRSQVVNLNFIETIGQWFSGSLKVRLRGGAEVEFSRRQAQMFRARLSL